MKVDISNLNKQFSKKTPEEILEYFIGDNKGEIAFSTSLGAEDQVITHMIANINKDIKIFTLDTGRLFYESYDLMDRTESKYDLIIEVMYPNHISVEKMVKKKGINLFYDSIENRKECCHVRKIEPWQRAIKGMKVWVTGIRSDQSVTRTKSEIVEFDEEYGLIKVNPLLNWKESEVWKYIHGNSVPYNFLHDKGYPSIGCAPCTRAVEKGENPRNGRWWWENPETRECGLHLHAKTN